MAKARNSDVNGRSFSSAIINAVWEKGATDPKYDSDTYRMDRYGYWMKKSNHGNTGDYGWEIDHIKPVSKGGGDELSNLQPLYWKNNRDKGDQYPYNR